MENGQPVQHTNPNAEHNTYPPNAERNAYADTNHSFYDAYRKSLLAGFKPEDFASNDPDWAKWSGPAEDRPEPDPA